MPDDNNETTLLNIRISESQKQDWKEYADAEGHGTLTNLIKHAVESTISDEWVLKSDTSIDVGTEDLDEGIGDIDSRLAAIEQQLDSLQSPTADEDRTEERELSRDELISLANRCHNRLPQIPSEDYLDTLVENSNIVEPAEKSMLTGTARDVADALDEPVYHVRQALIWLEKEQHAGIESRIDDGIRRWYEVDPSIDMEDLDDITPDSVDKPVGFESGNEI